MIGVIEHVCCYGTSTQHYHFGEDELFEDAVNQQNETCHDWNGIFWSILYASLDNLRAKGGLSKSHY